MTFYYLITQLTHKTQLHNISLINVILYTYNTHLDFQGKLGLSNKLSVAEGDLYEQFAIREGFTVTRNPLLQVRKRTREENLESSSLKRKMETLKLMKPEMT